MVAVWVASWIGNLFGALTLPAVLYAAGSGVLLTDGSPACF